MDDEPEDARVDELSSIEAIFPEIQKVNENDPFTFSLDLPVNPVKPVVVTFPAASTATAPVLVNGAGGGARDGPAAQGNPIGLAATRGVDSHELSYLPSVSLRISLPEGYPAQQPPKAVVSANPPWLTADVVTRLESDAKRLWEDMGRDMVAYTYIDHVQQAAENVFDMVNANGTLEVDPAHKLAILDYDIKSRRAAFEKDTFDCGVCLDPKKGSACYKMMDCGHIFCRDCLQEFYNNAIKEGDLATIRCLSPSCAKEREATQSRDPSKKHRKPKTYISPSELLQIGLSQDAVSRYVSLKYKNELESDKNTIYCPRKWCDGAAKSKKHKKPMGLDLEELSDDESEEAVASGTAEEKLSSFKTEDLLAICEDCGFAFCSRCQQSWHGEFIRCNVKRDESELSAEEAASLKYLEFHTSPCPTCDAPAQKTHGCNHMICFICKTHFCYLCSAWLDESNPYAHFNMKGANQCYQRLWELEEGDGDDVGVNFAGGAQLVRPQQRPQRPAQRPLPPGRVAAVDHAIVRDDHGVEVLRVVPEIEEPEDEDSDGDEPSSGEDEDGENANVGVAREGPLVLRIGGGPRPARTPPLVPPAVPAPPEGRGGRRQDRPPRGRGGGRGGGRARGNRRGAGRGGARPNGPPVEVEMNQGDELDPAQREWVRQFVLMALNDEEDSSSEDENEHDFVLLGPH